MNHELDAVLYKKGFDEATDMIFVADAVTGMILDCNKSAANTLGYAHEEIVGRHQRFLHPDTEPDQGFTRAFRDSLALRDGHVIHDQVLAKDGHVLDVDIRASVYKHKGRTLMLGVFRDVTERVRYEERIWDLSRFPEDNPNPVLRADAQNVITYANAASCEVLHLGSCSLHDTLPEEFHQAIARALEQDTLQALEVQHGERYYHYAVSHVPDSGFVNIYGMEVTQRRLAEQALARSEERYRLALKAANFGSWDWDLISDHVTWSETMEHLFGMEPGSLGNSREELLRIMVPEDRVRVNKISDAAIQHGRELDVEFRIHDNQNELRWLRATGAVYHDDHGRPVRLSGIIQDITEQKQAGERIEYMAMHDSLTGLYNREAFMDHLGKALSHTKRTGKRLALLFLDLDGFKGVNDALGHAAGDEVLKTVAHRLEKAIRHMDVAARLGGDEFALLLRDFDDPSHAEEVAGRLVRTLSQPISVEGQTQALSVSIGIALSPDHATDLKSLLRCSDKAMYSVKNAGRNDYALCPPDRLNEPPEPSSAA